MACMKFKNFRSVSQRISTLFKQHLFLPEKYRSRERNPFRAQLAASFAESIFERHHQWLHDVFQSYASVDSDQTSAGVSMSLTEFQLFITETGMISNTTLSYRVVKSIFTNVQMDEPTEDLVLYGGKMEMVYWEFLESVAALACFVYKNPYLPLENKLDEFICTVLKPNKKIEKRRFAFAFKKKKKEQYER